MSIVQIPVHRRGREPVFALVDETDEPLVSTQHWMLTRAGAQASVRTEAGTKTVLMHRLVLGNPSGPVIAKDGNKLNCTRQNLKASTQAEICLRSRPRSGFRGVFKDRNRFRAAIAVNGKTIHLGSFDNPVDAARRYDSYVRETIGGDALTNADLGLLRSA